MSWSKIKGAPSWLEVRVGKFKTSYRTNHRAKPYVVQGLGEFDTWKKAAKAGEVLIAQVRLTGTPENPNLVRCEDLLDEMVEIVKPKADATWKQKEWLTRMHLKPWLNSNCAHAKDLNSTVWDLYRAFKRTQVQPNGKKYTLKAHAEIFGGLVAYAHRKGILKAAFELDYDRERDDFAEDGMVIPKADLIAMLRAVPVKRPGKPYKFAVEVEAFEVWRDRIILQRATGMRPGEVRLLQKDRVTIVGDKAVIRLRKEDTKTRQARPVPLSFGEVVEILKRRMQGESPYLFPQRGKPLAPVSNHFKGWHAILERAGIKAAYTPHDIRHTFLSDMFRNSNNPALICFTCGLSLEEAQKTYLHFTEEDGFLVSDEAALRITFLKKDDQ